MKERIIIDEDFYVKHFQEREIEFQEEDMCSGGNPEEWWHYKKEQVPETFADLQELCRNLKIGDCEVYITLQLTDKMKLYVYDNGEIIGAYSDFEYEFSLAKNRTYAQMWKIIKNLAGENES